jgi:hypothetical protein
MPTEPAGGWAISVWLILMRLPHSRGIRIVAGSIALVAAAPLLDAVAGSCFSDAE